MPSIKRESELRTAYLAEVKRSWPSCIALRHEDVRWSGTPDLSQTAGGRTTWIEFKHATPEFSGTGLQEKICSDLAREGFCRYVVWCDFAGFEKKTMIIHPRVVKASVGRPQARKPWLMEPEAVTMGFDHRWLVQYFQGIHRC